MAESTGNLLLDRQLARWYPLKDIQVQLDLVNAVANGIRFPVVPAVRRSGKTERQSDFSQSRRYQIQMKNTLQRPLLAIKQKRSGGMT